MNNLCFTTIHNVNKKSRAMPGFFYSIMGQQQKYEIR